MRSSHIAKAVIMLLDMLEKQKAGSRKEALKKLDSEHYPIYHLVNTFSSNREEIQEEIREIHKETYRES